MLRGEGKENDDKTTIGLISKNTSLHVQHIFFFVNFFAVVLHDNVKLPSYAIYGGNVVRVFFVYFFFYCRSFSPWWPLGFLINFCHRRYKIFMSFFNNKWLLISRSSSMLLFFSLSFAGLSPTFSFSLSFSCPIFQICGHDN